MNKEELAELAYQKGYEYEQKNQVCAQCCLAALQDAIGDIDDSVFKAAYTLGGGGALTREGTCGALAGGLLAIGSRFGRSKADFNKKFDRSTNRLAKQLTDRFFQEFGGYTCRAVQTHVLGQSFDFWDETENKAFKDAGAHTEKCPMVVGTGAKIAAEIILTEEERRRNEK